MRLPVPPIAHQHGIGARPLRVRAADHQPDFAQPGETDSPGKGPRGVVPYRDGPIRRGRDEWHQVCHRNVWPLQPDGVARCLLAAKAVGLQIPVLLQQAEPVFVAVAGHGDPCFSEIPTVAHEDAKRHFMLNRRFQ